MKLHKKTFRIDNENVKYITIIQTDECEPYTDLSTYHQDELLKTLATTPEICICGTTKWEKICIYHNGFKWIAELEAVVYEPSRK